MERVIVSVRLENDPEEWDLELPAEVQAAQLAGLIAGALNSSSVADPPPRIEAKELGRLLRDDETLASVGAWDGSSLILVQCGPKNDDASGRGDPDPEQSDRPFPAGYMLRLVTGGPKQSAKNVEIQAWPIVANPWWIGRRGGALEVHTDLSHIPKRSKIHHNHCYLEFDPDPGGWFLTRAGRRYGTYVVRKSGAVYGVRRNERRQLDIGDEIHLADGAARLLFTRVAES